MIRVPLEERACLAEVVLHLVVELPRHFDLELMCWQDDGMAAIRTEGWEIGLDCVGCDIKLLWSLDARQDGRKLKVRAANT